MNTRTKRSSADQMLTRLPVSLAQLKAVNIHKNNYEIRQLLYFLWLKRSINIWLQIFKNGNSFYEHWK